MARSPFPGMDPFLEASGLWGDFHHTLIADIQRQVGPQLPPKYIARTEERSYILTVESEEKANRIFIPDVSVTGPSSRFAVADAPAKANGGVSMRAFIEVEFEETFLDIYELGPERRLVTSIEVLSPANKARGTKGWKLYNRKRQALLLGKANLVEIDLLRRGTRLPMLDPWPDAPYTVLVARKSLAPACKVWPAHSDRPLPAVPVPLSRGYADLTLELQPLVEAIYKRNSYAEQIDYTRPLDPPLRPEEAAFLKNGKSKKRKR